MDLVNLFQGSQSFDSQLSQFAASFKNQSNASPEETVKQMLKDGRMTKEQFNTLSQMANMIMANKR